MELLCHVGVAGDVLMKEIQLLLELIHPTYADTRRVLDTRTNKGLSIGAFLTPSVKHSLIAEFKCLCHDGYQNSAPSHIWVPLTQIP